MYIPVPICHMWSDFKNHLATTFYFDVLIDNWCLQLIVCQKSSSVQFYYAHIWTTSSIRSSVDNNHD